MAKDLYHVLKIDRSADLEEIKKAYRKAAKKHHPDVSPRGEDRFKEIQEAYETLSNPDKKARYDRQYQTEEPCFHAASTSNDPDVGFQFAWLEEIDRFFTLFEDPSLFEDKEDAKVLHLRATLTRKEAASGGELAVSVPLQSLCRRCRGSGTVDGLICGRCRGRGKEKIAEDATISIPPQVKDGTVLRIPWTSSDTRRIDLVVTFRVAHR